MVTRDATSFNDGRDFQRLLDGTPDPRSIPNIRLALDRLGVARGQRVNGRKLFAEIARKFKLVPTSDRRRQALRWIADEPLHEPRRPSRESLVEINQTKREYPTVVEVTLKEIAEREGIHYVYAHRLSREKGFPDPVRSIGRNLMFDANAVSRFFAKRKRRASHSRQ